jgi:hypothetical protein
MGKLLAGDSNGALSPLVWGDLEESRKTASVGKKVRDFETLVQRMRSRERGIIPVVFLLGEAYRSGHSADGPRRAAPTRGRGRGRGKGRGGDSRRDGQEMA